MRFLAELVAKRKQYKEYLQYGTMMRAPKLKEDYSREIDLIQMTIYSYKDEGTNIFPFKKVVPMLYSGAWRNEKSDILLTFVNISEERRDTAFSINLDEMGLTADYTLYIDGVAQDGAPQSNYEVAIDGCSTKIFEFKKN
jgi:hypothetical protein